MNIRLFGCGKFKFLAIEKFDRQLTPKEVDFYRKHREVCFTCMRYEQQGTNAMNLLSAAVLEPEISDNFDERVMRMLRKPQRRFSLGYWSPVLAGAAVAGLAVIATLQVIQRAPAFWNNENSYTPGASLFNENQQATQRNLILPIRSRS